MFCIICFQCLRKILLEKSLDSCDNKLAKIFLQVCLIFMITKSCLKCLRKILLEKLSDISDIK